MAMVGATVPRGRRAQEPVVQSRGHVDGSPLAPGLATVTKTYLTARSLFMPEGPAPSFLDSARGPLGRGVLALLLVSFTAIACTRGPEDADVAAALAERLGAPPAPEAPATAEDGKQTSTEKANRAATRW